jgi:hypothetical protein
MLASGQKRTHFTAPFYDCFPLKADIRQREWHVRYVPQADIALLTPCQRMRHAVPEQPSRDKR